MDWNQWWAVQFCFSSLFLSISTEKKLLEIYSEQINIYRFTSFAKDIFRGIGEIPGFGKI